MAKLSNRAISSSHRIAPYWSKGDVTIGSLAKSEVFAINEDAINTITKALISQLIEYSQLFMNLTSSLARRTLRDHRPGRRTSLGPLKAKVTQSTTGQRMVPNEISLCRRTSSCFGRQDKIFPQ